MSDAYVHYCLIDAASGRIVQAGTCPPETFEAQSQDPYALLRTPLPANPLLHWVDVTTTGEPILEERPTLAGFDKTAIAADGVDQAVMAGVPVGAVPYINGVEQPAVMDGTLEIASSVAGVFRVTVDHFPYRFFEEIVTAT